MCKSEKIDCCEWETASNVTTEPPSTDARGSSEGSESDHEFDSWSSAPCGPPGQFQAQPVQQFAIVNVLQPAFFCMPTVGVTQANEMETLAADAKRKKRVTTSAWGA